MNGVARDDIKAAFSFAVRVGIDQGLSLDELSEMLRSSHEEAQRIAQKKDVSKGPSFRSAEPGSFVIYKDKKGVEHTALVVRVKNSGFIDLRTMRTAQPNLDFEDVPFAARPTPEHWSYRQ